MKPVKRSWWKYFKFWVSDEKEMKMRPHSLSEPHPSEIGEKKPGGKTFFGIKLVWPFVLMILAGCSTPTTKFSYESPQGNKMTVEMPKEMEAVNLNVEFDVATGNAKVHADSIKTKSLGLVRAEFEGRAQTMEAVSKGISEGVAESLKKSILPIP